MDKRISAKENLSTIQQQIRERFDLIVKTLNPALGDDVLSVFDEPGTLLSHRSARIKEKGFISPGGLWSLLPAMIATSIDPDLSSDYVVNIALAVELFVAAFDLLQTIEENRPTLLLKERGTFLLFNIVTALFALSQQTLLSIDLDVQHAQALLSILQIFQQGTSTSTTHFYQLSNAEKPGLINNIGDPYEIFLSLACHIGAVSAHANPKLSTDFAQLGTLFGRNLNKEETDQPADPNSLAQIRELLVEIGKYNTLSPSLHLLLQNIS